MGYRPKKELKQKYSINDAVIMRPTDVALYYNIAVNTVWRWLKIGILPEPTRIGSRFTFWKREDIENTDITNIFMKNLGKSKENL